MLSDDSVVLNTDSNSNFLITSLHSFGFPLLTINLGIVEAYHILKHIISTIHSQKRFKNLQNSDNFINKNNK
jgi:hypothetical protein